MPESSPTRPLPGISMQVFPARALWVSSGVNHGDAISATDAEPGDMYRLDRGTPALRLLLAQPQTEGEAPCLSAGTQIGKVGEPVVLRALLSLMAPDSERVKVLLISLQSTGLDYALPLSPLEPGADYTLLAAPENPGDVRLGDVVCVSLARGTAITLPGGARRAIEDLAPGDTVLTRDHGAQALRWIGRATLRAQGSFAPVVISAGALGNLGDLVVSQHHRMFLYQRGQRLPGRPAELLAQAKHLVDGKKIFLREQGYVDYYSLVFDSHEIIYAEGIPCESLMVSEALLQRLPSNLAASVRAQFPGLSQTQHFGTEAGREELASLSQAAPPRSED